MRWLKQKDLRELLIGSGLAFVLKVAGSVLSFGLSITLTRLLGAEGAGAYFLALTIVTLVAACCRVGLDHAMVRFTAICRTENDEASLSYLSRHAIGITFILSVLGCSLLFVCAPSLAVRVFAKPELVSTLELIAFGGVFYALVLVLVPILKGMKRVRDSQILEVIMVPALIIIGILSLNEKMGHNAAPLSFLLASFLTALLGLVMTRCYWLKEPAAIPRVDQSLLLRTSLPLLGVIILNMLTNSGSSLLLGYFSTLEDVALYNAAYKAAFLTTILLASVATISGQKFSTLYASGRKAELEGAVREINLALTLLSGVILLFYLLLAREIMSLFGEEFQKAAGVLAVLAVGQSFSVSSGSVGQLIIMCGYERASLNIVVATCILCILLNLLLIPTLGVMGAAIATSATLVSKNLIGIIFVYRRIGLSVLPFFPRREVTADHVA